MCACVHLCLLMEDRNKLWVPFLKPCLPQSLSVRLRACWSGLAGWPVSPSAALISPVLRVQVHNTMLGFSCVCWGLNLGPHTYKASTSPTEPSLHSTPIFRDFLWLAKALLLGMGKAGLPCWVLKPHSLFSAFMTFQWGFQSGIEERAAQMAGTNHEAGTC